MSLNLLVKDEAVAAEDEVEPGEEGRAGAPREMEEGAEGEVESAMEEAEGAMEEVHVPLLCSWVAKESGGP